MEPSTWVTTPGVFAWATWPLSTATRCSMPVATSGASGRRSGTACRCMFDPISALLASSCSRNGIRAVETLTICMGETSIRSTSSTDSMAGSAWVRVSTLSGMSCPRSSVGMLACATTRFSSSSAGRYTMSSGRIETKGRTATARCARALILWNRAWSTTAPAEATSLRFLLITSAVSVRPTRSASLLDSSRYTRRYGVSRKPNSLMRA